MCSEKQAYKGGISTVHILDRQAPGVLDETAFLLSRVARIKFSARYIEILNCEMRGMLLRNGMGHLIRKVG
jgi:hypothetical protein